MNGMRVYIDSNVFIFSAVSLDEKGDDARKLLTLFAKGAAWGLTSALTFDEVFHRVKKEISHEAAISLMENLLMVPNLSFLSADAKVLNACLLVLRKHKIEPRDAIHVATSFLAGADMFVTDDKALLKIDDVKTVSLKNAISKIEKGP